MTPLPISASLISSSEASRVRTALESVAGWTMETVVVLNDDVQDGTEEICREYGAKVFREAWKGHIEQKNSAAVKSSQPWILGLDADEAVSDSLREEIQRTFANGATHPAAYAFPRCTQFCGRWIRHGEWYPDRQTRLWQRSQARWGGVNPHDKLVVEGVVRHLQGDLLHYMSSTIDNQIRKITPYSTGFLEASLSQGRQASVVDLGFRPFWRFFRSYCLRAGFLDGWQGYYLAWYSAFQTATRYAKVRHANERR